MGVDSRLQPSCKLRLGGQGGDKSPGLQLVLVQELSTGDGEVGGGLVGWGGGWSGAETSKPVPRELQACRHAGRQFVQHLPVKTKCLSPDPEAFP